MPEPYQPLSVSTGSAQSAIQGTPNVTPSLDGLMQGIRDGFISADDIRKRVSNGPLEAATRQQDLADVTQVRPLQREAAVAQLENVKAKEQFEAESLPILNDAKREALKQEYENVLQHGVPKAVLDTFNKTVPGFIPYDNAKLFPKEGGVNTAYALEIMGKAFEKAEKLKRISGLKPTTFKKVGPAGEEVTSEQVVDPITGEAFGVSVVTGTKAAQTGANTKEIRASRFNPANSMEEETVQQFDTVTGKLIGEATVVGSKPVKLTKEQSDAVQFSDRMGFNNQLVSDLSTKGFDPTALKTTVQSYLPNRFQPDALQSYTAAKNNWITAALRKESGAAISANEYVQANREYFPRDGDSPGVVKQKEALRALAEEDIRLNTPNGGFWNPGGGRRHIPGVNPAGANPSTPAVPGAPTAPTPEAPIIDITDRAAAAAAANALPSNIPFFKWAGSEEKYNNPNYVAPR